MSGRAPIVFAYVLGLAFVLLMFTFRSIGSTAGVVTSTAAVMIAVFSVFATLSALDMKQMGVGLAVAVLIDATIVRAVLPTATMKLLGDWNRYLPSWLGWMPRVGREPEPEDAAA